MRRLAVGLFFLSLLHGAEAGAGEHHGPSIWLKWANFAILAGGLGYLLAKKAGPYFQSRTAQIQASLREAAQAAADAAARAAEIDRRLAQLNEEIARMRAASAEQMKAEAERIRGETAKALARIESGAAQEIARAAKLARQELRTFAAGLAVAGAAEEIRRRMSGSVQSALIERFVADLAALGRERH